DAQVDAVVRPSGFLQKEVDYTMTNGGAVEKAIGRIGGRQIYEQAVALAARQEEINPHSADAKIYGANLGDSVVTDAGALEPDIKRVIHVMCHQTFGHAIDQEAIRQTVISALNQASWAGLESVMFPVIGGGISTRSHDSVITSNESAVATLNAIRVYLEAEPGSSVKNVGLIFYDRDGTETSGTIADKLNDVPAASLLTFPLTSTDGQQIDLKLAITQPEATATPEAESNSLPIVMVAGKTYLPDELIDVLTSDELRTFSSSLLKFVRADVIDGESRGSVIFIDRFGGDHNIIYARGREKLTQEGGIFYGQDVRFQLIDAGRMYIRPTHTREQGDYLLEVTETSGTLSDGLRSSRRSRS
ncbi:MAG: macro domain-containing protein, partial [Patescibacteria group bacterium]|nr:macro domain-containing protein [Patescibacteria group bacterium]